MNIMKALETYDLGRDANGTVRFFSIDREGNVRKMVRLKNLILYGGADVLAKLLSGASGFHISTMYMEFVNLAAPGDPVTIPTFDRSGGLDYYNGLSASGDLDFLRIPLQIANTLSSSDDDLYAYNKVTFVGVSEGTQGFHGKTFGPAANSAVYGAALVASPDQTDQSQDLVFSRVYAGGVSGWTEAVEKEAGTQIAVTWTIRFN
jgi:hypothetical protein